MHWRSLSLPWLSSSMSLSRRSGPQAGPQAGASAAGVGGVQASSQAAGFPSPSTALSLTSGKKAPTVRKWQLMKELGCLSQAALSPRAGQRFESRPQIPILLNLFTVLSLQ